MNRTNYPHEILPKQNWKQYVPPSEIICVCQDAILGRMLEGREEDCLDSSLGEDMVSILPEKLPLKRIAGLSCSLLGTTFIVDFFQLFPKFPTL